MIKNKNFSGSSISKLGDVEDGEIFMYCNFSRHILGDLVIDASNVVFFDCNLTNCILSAGSSVQGKKYGVNKSFCKNLHPEWDDLPDCKVDCEHVIDVDELFVDGLLVKTIYHYKDLII